MACFPFFLIWKPDMMTMSKCRFFMITGHLIIDVGKLTK